VVHNWSQLTERVKQISSELQDDALAEEFIEGREVYVGVLGTADRPEVLPVVELDFGRWENGVPRVSDREVKFAPETDGSPKLVMAKLTPELQAEIERAALITFRALQLKDYARVDFRISEMGDPYVLEANPNPYLESNSELAMAAEARGMGFAQLIDRILESAARRYKLKRFLRPAREPKAEKSATETNGRGEKQVEPSAASAEERKPAP
jgi:D-alanine-D-alanine ligase